MSHKLVKGILFSLSIAMIVLFHPTPVYALTSGEIDQTQLEANNACGIAGTYSATQTFVPGKNGQLTKVDVKVNANQMMPGNLGDLQMQLIDMDTKANLFSTTLTKQEVLEMKAATGYVTFTVDPGVQLSNSKSYGIKLSSPDTTGILPDVGYEWFYYAYANPYGSGSDQYQNGTLICSHANDDEKMPGDAVFRTYMVEKEILPNPEPTPEPTVAPTEEIDQTQLEANNACGIAGTCSATQTFVPGRNGQLTKVDVKVNANQIMPGNLGDLQMQLIDMDTKAILFNTTLTKQKVLEMKAATGYVTFTVNPGVQLSNSKSYGIKLSSPDTTGILPNVGYEWFFYAYANPYGSGSDQYQDGTLIYSRANDDEKMPGDAVFRTYMIETTEEIDQAQLEANNACGIAGTYSATQTFIPGKNGQLTKVDVKVNANQMMSGNLGDLQMQLIDMDTKANLFSTTLTKQEVLEMKATTGYVTFTVDPGVQLSNSKSYGIKLSSPDTTGMLPDVGYEWFYYAYANPYGSGSDQYQNGTLICSQANDDEMMPGDTVFRTYISN